MINAMPSGVTLFDVFWRIASCKSLRVLMSVLLKPSLVATTLAASMPSTTLLLKTKFVQWETGLCQVMLTQASASRVTGDSVKVLPTIPRVCTQTCASNTSTKRIAYGHFDAVSAFADILRQLAITNTASSGRVTGTAFKGLNVMYAALFCFATQLIVWSIPPPIVPI